MLRREQEGPDTPLPPSSEAMGPTVPLLALGVVLLTVSDSQVQWVTEQMGSVDEPQGREGWQGCVFPKFLSSTAR